MSSAVKGQMNGRRSGLIGNLQPWPIKLVNHDINPKAATRRTHLLLPAPFTLVPHPWYVIGPLLVVLHKGGKVLFVLLHKIHNQLPDLPVVLRPPSQLVRQRAKETVPVRGHDGDAGPQGGDLLLEALLLVLAEALAFGFLVSGGNVVCVKRERSKEEKK